MNIAAEKQKRGNDWNVIMSADARSKGKRVGTIRQTSDGWAYNPAHTKIYGETFPSMRACLNSLRAE